MTQRTFTITPTVNRNESADYIAKINMYKPKDKYKRLNEYSLVANKDPLFLRSSYSFDNPDKTLPSIKLENEFRFSLLPYIPLPDEQERSCIYISGASGNGKSYVVNEIVQSYKEIYPSNICYFITKNDWKNDRSLNPKSMYQFLDTMEFIEKMSDPEEINKFLLDTEKKYYNSFWVFDDIDSLKHDPAANKVIWQIIDIILENKRKFNMSICVISHIPTNFRQTRLLIRELRQYIFFPRVLQAKSDNILNTYLGLSKKQVKKIVEEDYCETNWVCVDVRKRIVIGQNIAYFV